MPQAGRVGDTAMCAADEHGGEAGSLVIGEATLGSPDVIINHRAALRAGDPGAHTGGGAGTWRAGGGSTGVFINGQPAFRHGDGTLHGSAEGELVDGSPDVFIGDTNGASIQDQPHDRTVTLDVTDALGRPIHEVTVRVSCPHQQHDDITVNGSAAISGLCRAAIVTVNKALQAGAWDDVTVMSGSMPQHHFQGKKAILEAAGDSGGVAAPKILGGSSGAADAASANGTGGALAPGNGGASAKVIHAPGNNGTAADKNGVHLSSPNGGTEVVLSTVHNWAELVYRAFGRRIPTGPWDLALLGVREASLRSADPGEDVPVDVLEEEAAEGDLDEVSFTRERKKPAYNDLLFCIWTDRTAQHRQHVEVFECTIDESPRKGTLHLPFLVEGRLFHATPGPYDNKRYPGKNVTLHVFRGKKERKKPKGTTAERVIQLAMKQRGITEDPPFSNRTKYGAWYGNNGVFWCAQFVSWVFAHCGMKEIFYQGCIIGADMFQKGVWGTWHGPDARAQPGDIVFYNFPGGDVWDHTGIVVKDNGSSITTVEGNTSAQGASGSQSNGGGVYLRTRPKDGTIIGYGRPRFAKPDNERGSFIRWGGEGKKVHPKSFVNSTVLHHHYFKKDKKGHLHPDPEAERYRRFMQLYNRAANKKRIPYLIVSSRYIRTYSEWVDWVNTHQLFNPGAKSVIRKEGLRSPTGQPKKYLPSFISKAYADKVLKKARQMKDRKKAARIRAALDRCLLKLKI